MNKFIRGSTRSFRLILFCAFAVFLTACYPDHPQSTFDTAGPVARSQLNLFYIIFWVAVVVFIAVEGALIYVAFRFRRRSEDEADPVQTHGNTRLEIGWTLAPVLVLLLVAIPTVLTVFDNANSPDPDGLSIDAIGHQWWFEFRYPHPVNVGEEIVAANELHIPVGEVVNVNLESEDVIHSFWIPKLAGKVDMVPNFPNFIWIQADESGEYYGQCAEFCGESHAKMKFRVIAESRTEFDAWLLSQAQPSVEIIEPLQAQGEALFKSLGCFGCHAISPTMKRAKDGSRLKGRIGPNLTHFASRGHMAAGVMEQTPENIRAWLSDPGAIKPGNVMAKNILFTDPEKRLTEQEISALVAYLRALK